MTATAMRSCGRCKTEYAPFKPRGQLCPDCDGTPPPSACRIQPRPCVRCHEVKPADEFPDRPMTRPTRGTPKPGQRKYRRRSTVCRECWKEDRATKKRERARRRKTWVTREGVTMRKCSTCGDAHVLEDGFFRHGTFRKDGTPVYMHNCKTCSKRCANEAQKRALADPERAPLYRARREKWRRQWRKKNAEMYRAAQRRYRERIMADPIRHAERLAAARIDYRLRQERRGRQVRHRDNLTTSPRGSQIMLPAAPLAEAVNRIIQRDMATVPHLVGASTTGATGATRATLCQSLGIVERRLRAWETGESVAVPFDVADKVLTASGLCLWDVWDIDADDFPVELLDADAA